MSIIYPNLNIEIINTGYFTHEILEILNTHRFVLSDKNTYTYHSIWHTFHCTICNRSLNDIVDTSKLLGGDIEIKALTCNEVIIKNILE